MRWKVFFGLSLACLSVLFLQHSSYAASQSFSYDSTSNPIAANTTFDSTLIGFTPNYVSVSISGYSDPGNYFSPFSIGLSSGNSFQPRFSTDFTGYGFAVYFLPGNVLYYFNYFVQNPQTYSSLVLTFSDTNPIVSTPCPDCPEVPDLPYGEKLDHLTAAIIFVPATMLVIYFMFAIYSMFFRGLK